MNFKVLLQLYCKATKLLTLKYNSLYDNEKIRKTAWGGEVFYITRDSGPLRGNSIVYTTQKIIIQSWSVTP